MDDPGEKSHSSHHILYYNKWVKVFKNGASKICGREPFKNLKRCGLSKQIISIQIFWRLSSTNLTWSILEYLDPNVLLQEQISRIFLIQKTNINA